MTYEEKYKQIYPGAVVTEHKQNGPIGKRYYLVRKSRGAFMWSGCGNTKAQAWSDAWKKEATK